MIVIKILLLILITDLVTGIGHWWEDAYGDPRWKVLGKSVVIPNLDHHKRPREFLKSSTWERIRLSFSIAVIIGLAFYFTGLLCWEVIFCLLYGSLANEVHAISHRTNKENGKLICAMQKIGLIQSRRMHGHHHTSPYDVNYSIMTNYLNPFLNKTKFWIGLEYLISLFGINPMRGSKIREGL